MRMHAPWLSARLALCSAALICSVSFFAPIRILAGPVSNTATASEPKTVDQPPATTDQTPHVQPVEAAGGTDFPVLRTIGGFALVISLILIAFLVARKIAPQYFNRHVAEKGLKVIETMSMGEKRSIAIIQVGDRRFLIGNTPHQISVLSSLEDSFPLLAAPDPVSEGAALRKPTNPFRRMYERERSRGGGKTAEGKTLPPDVRAKMRQLRAALEG
jgi:flagellar biosynthetic protein FliO